MTKKKVHELAKEIDIKSKDIVSFLKDKGFEKTHMSSIDEPEISLIESHFQKSFGITNSADKADNNTIIKKAPTFRDNKMAEEEKNKADEAKNIRSDEHKKQVKSNQGERNLQVQEQLDNTDNRISSQNQVDKERHNDGQYRGDRERHPDSQNQGDKERQEDSQNQGDKERRPDSQNQGDRERRPGSQNQGDRDRRNEGQGDKSRHAGGQGERDRRLGGQGDKERRPYQGDRDRRQGSQYQGERRPEGQYQGERRPEGQNQGERRPEGQNQERRPGGQYQGERRPGGQYQGERRPEGQNQGERRPEGQNQGDRRPTGQGQGEHRPGNQYQGDRERRPGSSYQGDRDRRPAGQGQYQGDRDRRPEGQGQSQGDRDRRPVGQSQGDRDRRPEGQYQGDRDRRPAGQGQYQGNRPAGQGQGDNDRRPAGQGQGDRDRRPAGQYQGNRPAGQYQGNRPAGQYQGNRPAGQYQGNRPAGQYQGNRPAGQGQGEHRPAGQGQGDNRRFGTQSQGQGNRSNFGTGFDKDKDKDSSYNNRGYDKRRQDTRVPDKSNIKTDLVKELTKEQRAAAFKEKDRDRNRSKKRDDIDNDKSRSGKSKKDPNRKGAFIMPKPLQLVREPEDDIKMIVIPEFITIKELAEKMKKLASAVVKKLFLQGKMVSINQEISYEEAEEIAIGYDIITEKEIPIDIVAEVLKEDDEDLALMEKRPPVVCVMGHVDHGKTSLLDAIRETNVTSKEAGGITQHIGAYVVEINDETITFLDTPGHEAFTSMRMRGAKSTDIAILVVAADDGVMPQTIEAISHAKAAGVQIIVAVNKIDKPSANIERVKQELTEYNLIAEDWGGDTVFVPVSAHTKEGIDTLLEMILLTADILELRANRNRKARGIVIEAELDKGKGTVATILVQKGTLHVGDSIAIGASYGKVRAMMDDKGRRVKEANVSTPVEILGLNEVPNAGEIFVATDTEKDARNIADTFIKQGRERLLADTKAKLSLDGLFTQIKAGNIKELNLIIKADVQGSVEAVKQSMLKLSNEEVAVRIVHGGVGTVNESDVTLAATSNAIIIGFNVRTDNTAREIAEREKVDLRLYKVIYNAIEDVESAMKGLLDPVYEEKVIAHAEVRQIFKASGLGVIAGSYVLDGKVTRGCLARITREGKKIYEGSLASLKRFKDDAKEVATGYECGLVFEKFGDLQEFDQVEFYVMKEVPR